MTARPAGVAFAGIESTVRERDCIEEKSGSGGASKRSVHTERTLLLSIEAAESLVDEVGEEA
jgi:hypothetical protein